MFDGIQFNKIRRENERWRGALLNDWGFSKYLPLEFLVGKYDMDPPCFWEQSSESQCKPGDQRKAPHLERKKRNSHISIQVHEAELMNGSMRPPGGDNECSPMIQLTESAKHLPIHRLGNSQIGRTNHPNWEALKRDQSGCLSSMHGLLQGPGDGAVLTWPPSLRAFPSDWKTELSSCVGCNTCTEWHYSSIPMPSSRILPWFIFWW